MSARKSKPQPRVEIIDDRDWEPRLHRNKDGTYLYCSNACGHGCTLAQYEQARALALVTQRKMGPGWTWRVWENIGWHCKVFDASGYIAIYPPMQEAERGTFHVMVDDEPFGSAGRWSAFDTDPVRALRALHKIIAIEAALIHSVSDAVSRSTTKKGNRSS